MKSAVDKEVGSKVYNEIFCDNFKDKLEIEISDSRVMLQLVALFTIIIFL
jgi:hypothetical protein